MKVIKIMPEYGTGPLWESLSDDAPFSNIEVKKLHITSKLRNEIENFSKIYQSTFDSNYPPDSGFRSKDDELAFEEIGVNIWRALIAELPSDVDIIYYSVSKQRLYKDINDFW